MSWASSNLSFLGSPNYGAYSAPNYAVYGAPNYAVYSAPNYAVYGAPNYAVYGAPNYAANQPLPAAPLAALPAVAPAGAAGTGAGGASGSGFAGGYGPVARFEYATPAGLGPLPWALDFASGDGWPSFPVELRINPLTPKPLSWQTGDWDPALRFWTLPFDTHLTEWLQDLSLGTPAVMAAREFAALHPLWRAGGAAPAPGGQAVQPSPLFDAFEADKTLLAWRTDWHAIDAELEELADLMRDDRMRYLEELRLQSAQATPFFVHLLGFDPASKPWTMELMQCASAIGNLVKMHYKAHYKRVRPSLLCPALAPPWGPPGHPSFPSGHATVSHLTALFLLSVPGISQRFGIFHPDTPGAVRPVQADADLLHIDKRYGEDQRCPLLWLAWRISRGRERLGLHYRSDSAAGRRLAALVWRACLPVAAQVPSPKPGEAPAPDIALPSLQQVLLRASAEWGG